MSEEYDSLIRGLPNELQALVSSDGELQRELRRLALEVRISRLESDILGLAVEQKVHRALRRKAFKVTVSADICAYGDEQLPMVEARGDRREISELQQQLADQAEEFGADRVCEMQVIPLGHGDDVLVRGRAVRTVGWQDQQRQDELSNVRRSEMIEELRRAKAIRADF